MRAGGTIIVSDKQGRLKPCLRCGYSLLHIAGARNCPECGLAVRISLSNDKSLCWSNPRWQRFDAAALALLAVGLLCTIVKAAGFWVIYGADREYYQMDDATLTMFDRVSSLASELSLIICGVALCLLTKKEGRYPDDSLGRRIVLGGGIVILVLGLLNAAVHRGLWAFLPTWAPLVLHRILSGPWIPLILAVLIGGAALDLGKRGGSRLLSRMSQLPAYPCAVGFWVWLLNLHRVFWWPLRSIVWDVAFPLSMLVTITLAIRVLLSNAREADANWISDP
jgi:hypothetical protein